MRNKVYEIVVELTKDSLNENANSVYISEQLNLSRNLIFQYLNELFADGKLVKINTRPVVFFDIKTIEKIYDIKLIKTQFKSKSELDKMLVENRVYDFEKLIGYNESLSNAVSQCKAMISYPPNGLPILLYGPTGTGKSFMAQLMYEYAVNKGLIYEDKKFLILNCSDYANNPELLTANLFGHKKGAFTGADKDNLGLIKLAEGGVLFLDEVHCLNAECQEKLFLFMDKGIYHMVGDNENWYKSNVRLIFATTEKPREVLLKTLLRRIPMNIKIPSLEERGINERLQLIHHLFEEEEKRIGKSIYISNLVYNALLNSKFIGNIGGLKNIIQVSCANALFICNRDNNRLEIHDYNLPKDLIIMNKIGNKMNMHNNQKMIPICDLKEYISNEREIIKLYDFILSKFKDYNSNKMSLDQFLCEDISRINQYYDYVVFSEKTDNQSKRGFIQNMLQNIFEIISKKYGFKFNNNEIIAISSYVYDYTQKTYELNNWNNLNAKEIKKLNDCLKDVLYQEYSIASEVMESIKGILDIDLDFMMINIITLNIKMMNHVVNLNKRIGVIIAHGYSTASSIADSANKLLDQYIFDSIDMPLYVSTQTIINKLNDYLNKIGDCEDLVLLVDMGSLEEIYKGINVSINSNIGIMNNITTKLALEIGNGIKNNMPLDEIFREASKFSTCNYRIINNRSREKVILCSCASGLGTAEKLKEIIENSLPKNIPIKVLTYNYNTLIEKHLNDNLFEKYCVVCIVGTLNPNIEGIKFIPIEDLIMNQTLGELNYYFEDYLNLDEIEVFKQNIIKNFSLSNIVNNLTILNPNKLLEYVTSAIDRLQELLHIKLNNNTCVGLYIHICCLIERLVKREAIDNYVDIEEFKENQLEFIKDVKEAFSVVEKYYSVEITIEEIAYIYDYIENS